MSYNLQCNFTLAQKKTRTEFEFKQVSSNPFTLFVLLNFILVLFLEETSFSTLQCNKNDECHYLAGKIDPIGKLSFQQQFLTSVS